jgi:hypothetical protein
MPRSWWPAGIWEVRREQGAMPAAAQDEYGAAAGMRSAAAVPENAD